MSLPAPNPEPLATSDRPREREQWFRENVYVHAPALKVYVRNTFPTVRDVDDVVQESFLRTFKAQQVQRIETVRAFLFRVARNISLDFLRRERVSPFQPGEVESANVVSDGPDAADRASMQEKVDLLADAFLTLNQRNREIFLLVKVHGKKRREVAEMLGISASTVDEHLAIALRRIEEYLRQRGLDGFHGK